MNKNTDERTIVISREMFNRIVPELEGSDPAFAASLVRHAARFNVPYRKELDKKKRQEERAVREVSKRVTEFVDQHRGKLVWIRDRALARIEVDEDFAKQIFQGDEEKMGEAIARSKALITFQVRVITKSPGGLGVLVEFPHKTQGFKPVRINVYLEHLSLEQPEGEVEATWDEIKGQEQLFRSLDLITPQERARVMRENLVEHLKGVNEFMYLQARVSTVVAN